ncbi:Non-specific lipid-transfer protein A [Linum grandiflorum]
MATKLHLAATLTIALMFIFRSPSSLTVTARHETYCSSVFREFVQCVPYIAGMSISPTACCEAINALNYKAHKDEDGPKLICQCIEDMAYVMNIRFIESRISSLNKETCHVSKSFPISNSMNCSKIGE